MTVDLDAYLGRIGYTGPLAPTRVVLADLHLAHLTHIPFSSIDALLFPPSRLGLAEVQEKLVGRHGGGYCLEHHLLFAAVLEAIGFRVSMHVSRVRNGGPGNRPRDVPRPHLVLLADLDGEKWLTDVSFGSGVLHPVPLRPGVVFDQYGWRFRLVTDGPEYVLQTCRLGVWLDLFGFEPRATSRADLTVLDHFARTHPASGLLTLHWAHRTDLAARWTFWAHWPAGRLRTVLIEQRVDGTTQESLVPPADRARVLAGRLGLRLPAGVHLPEQQPDPVDLAGAALGRYRRER